MKVAIIDYEAGNLRNVQKAIEKFNIIAEIVSDAKDLKTFDAIVLPGVGSFFYGMKKLNDLKFVDAIKEEVLEKKKPFLGICLGMQLIGSKGEEGKNCEGLNLLPFEVKQFDLQNLSIPHIGWNNLTQKSKSKLFINIPDLKSFTKSFISFSVIFFGTFFKSLLNNSY